MASDVRGSERAGNRLHKAQCRQGRERERARWHESSITRALDKRCSSIAQASIKRCVCAKRARTKHRTQALNAHQPAFR
eukprot:2352245-Lingulodinium_polyedra.AAC.1